MNIQKVNNDRTILNGLELDFYIPSLNFAIEFDSLYYHSEYSGGKNKKYHINKTKLCESKNIHLIHIFDDEWIYKKDIVISKLLHLLKINSSEIISARKCSLKLIDNTQKRNYLRGIYF